MSAIDGGPAFPSRKSHEMVQLAETYAPGMSLRDYFAAQALVGTLANHELLVQVDTEFPHLSTREAASVYAYSVADKMLKAREGKR